MFTADSKLIDDRKFLVQAIENTFHTSAEDCSKRKFRNKLNHSKNERKIYVLKL